MEVHFRTLKQKPKISLIASDQLLKKNNFFHRFTFKMAFWCCAHRSALLAAETIHPLRYIFSFSQQQWPSISNFLILFDYRSRHWEDGAQSTANGKCALSCRMETACGPPRGWCPIRISAGPLVNESAHICKNTNTRTSTHQHTQQAHAHTCTQAHTLPNKANGLIATAIW